MRRPLTNRRSNARRGALTLALVCSGYSARAAAEPGAGYSETELVTMYQIAVQELDSREDRCVVQNGALMGDPESERAFARSALMVSLFVAEYPFPPGSESERSALVHRVVVGYERAFDCNPAWDKRNYLNAANTALDGHLQRIREVERRPLTEPDVVTLIQDRKRIQARIEGLRQPVCPTKEELCPLSRGPDKPASVEEPRGYRAWRERLSLRLEVGGGSAFTKEPPGEQETVGVFSFMVSAGSRFRAGKKGRHVFVLGALYGLHRFTYEASQRNAHVMLARAEYGVRVHPRWLSVHVAAEGGLELITAPMDRAIFGHGLGGFSAALCTWNEAICGRVRYLRTPAEDSYMDGPYGLIGFDVFRIIDNFTAKGETE